MSKVLLVGGAGYVGGAVTSLLVDSEHDVMVYDALLYEDSYLKGVPFAYGDIRDSEKLKPYLAWADVVVWLAALVGDGACALNPGLTKELNQDSVKWLAENFSGRIIFMSTCSVYGAQDDELDENSPTNPLSLYAATKLAAEDYLKDKNAIIFRLGTLFGLGDRFARIRLDLVVNTLTARAYTDNKLQIFGGNQYRPLLHVADAASAVVDAIDSDKTGIFNLHHDNMRINELAELVVRQIPTVKVETVKTTVQDARDYQVSSAKAREMLEFDPRLSAEHGILEIIKLLEAGRIKDIHNPRYYNAGYLEGLWK